MSWPLGRRGRPSSPSWMLLDQVSSHQLTRLTAGRPRPTAPSLAMPGRRRAARPGRARRVIGGVLLPITFLALSLVSITATFEAVVRATSDSDGVTWPDVAPLAVLVLITGSALRQGLVLLRLPLPRRAAANRAPAGSVPALLLDQVDADLAVPSRGRLPLSGPSQRTGSRWRPRARRWVDTAAWLILSAISITFMTVATLRVGAAVVAEMAEGAWRPILLLRLVVLALAAAGLALVIRAAVVAMLDRRRRRRRRAAVAFARQLLQVASADRGRDRSAPVAGASGAVAVMVVAATVAAGVATWPAAFGAADAGGSGSNGPIAVGPPLSSPRANGETDPGQASPASTGGPIPWSTAVPSSPLPPTAAPAGTPRPDPTQEAPDPPATSEPPTGPMPLPTPKPTPKPSLVTGPTNAPPSTVGPVETDPPVTDHDLDGVLTAIETLYGSDPHNPLSQPEHALFDQKYGKTTCSDGPDNDLDFKADGADTGCQT